MVSRAKDATAITSFQDFLTQKRQTTRFCTCPPSLKFSQQRWRARLVHRRREHRKLFPGKNYSRTKFTYQMSDHLPIWIQVKIDIDGFRLDQIVQDARE
jgi:hypothetical protein